ncbi:hypothetical protein [Conexibacter sp. SYSU D00693]|uniref:hypothetical protein n=1 Tax=Conexibacter sp. SYSU D00693 TaxID=2812560 RepID=UPI00196A9C39|nr:hypothetical protein [Conexibacter sp. SYSU D00693]
MPRLRTVLSTAALATAAAVSTAPAAHAAANPYTPKGVCGSSYRVLQQHDLKGPKGGVLGTVYLMWSGATKKNCAVTIKRRSVGIPSWTEASIAKKGGNYKAQDGFFKYYAGPLYVHAPGTCVIFGGRMRDHLGNGDSWITPRFGHCG